MLGGNTVEQYRAHRAEVPKLDISTIEPLGTGNNNEAVHVMGGARVRGMNSA